jgi:hypothetical protein
MLYNYKITEEKFDLIILKCSFYIFVQDSSYPYVKIALNISVKK